MNEPLMIIPRWSTIGLFLMLVIQPLLFWLQAKKTGKHLREAVLPNALMAGAVSIIFVREFFGDLPVWIEAPLVILCSLMILFVVGLAAVRLKRYLKEAWRLEDKNDK
jgi:uncharacterized membrane protein YoaK (UPF0700 family)